MRSLIIVILVLALLGVLGYFVLKSSGQAGLPSASSLPEASTSASVTSGMKDYVNTKYGYQIDYPSSLAIREFPDIGTGAGFRPAEKAAEPQYEVISVSVYPKIKVGGKFIPFADYAKVAAEYEIQGYGDLNSIKQVTTDSGLVGYETTWVVAPPPMLGLSGQSESTISLPRVYFDLPNSDPPSTVQVALEDEDYLEEFREMAKTFALKGN